MSIELKLIFAFIFHLIGDYILQNNWMATEKVKRFFPAAIHAITYSLLFLTITNVWAWLIILITHFFIDRYRLAIYWIKLVNWNWDSNNFGFPQSTLTLVSFWLSIIIDNVWHIIINSTAIYFIR